MIKMENAPTEYGKCNTCKEEKDTIAFGQCDDCFEKEMEENGSVIYDPN
jgi:hypothetical protein